MSSYRLDKLFAPRSVAVIGASPRERSLGRSILKNVVFGGFDGPVRLVSPRHAEVDGIKAVKSIADLPEAADVVVLATPPVTIPQLVDEAGRKGIAACVIITAGLGHGPGSLAQAADDAARKYGIRLVGPNCLGVIVPPAKLNASFAIRMPRAGDLALISQSGAIVAGVVEWAAQRAIGFSAVVSLGDNVDVDFGDLLDYFALDRGTRAILLYVESVKDARKFMSAARAAARTKPVVVIKAGRHAQSAQAAKTHTGALAGSDAVYDAAFRRVGLLRAYDLDELFDAAETLGLLRPFAGDRLAILTNGGGVGVLAVDRLIDFGGKLAEVSLETLKRLDAALPPTWSRGNPVDIIGDADEARYAAAFEALLDDPANDAILVLNVPTTLGVPHAIAARVADIAKADRAQRFPPKPVLAAWIGEDETASATFSAAGIPHYPTDVEAVRGYMHLVDYSKAQARLMVTPPGLPADFSPDANSARIIVNGAINAGRMWLDPVEATQVCEAYGIPIAATIAAHDPDEAAKAAAPMLAAGQRVAVKIFSHDIVHKSDVDGVRLGLQSEDEVRKAAAEIIARARALRPAARINGVTVHPMIERPGARELIVGVADDPTFGPIIAFGHGGTAVEVINDKALALPPLDLNLARDLIARTRISRLLKAYRNVPAAKEDEVALALVKLSQLVADLPEIREIDINPLLADEKGATAVDARIAVELTVPKFKGRWHPRMAIRPYPREWERHLTYGDGQIAFVRPIRPEDEPLFAPFFERVTDEDLRLRFFSPAKDFGHSFVARLTQIDYARAMAFAAIDEAANELLGVVRIHSDSDYRTAEYAILLRSDLKGRGLGGQMMALIITYARSEGLEAIHGQVLTENTVMLDLCRRLGFTVEHSQDDAGIVQVRLPLKKA
ncbi:MAG: bifunctional acetate--CoA ligase family protein/GNAT family N-acetyltransferase [Bradyrhizobiaceae bacterium]|nr:bifunctional acetate--CoA ligase family protein/GNAT family N-acetyltransferase [Bradyrhizobiaceae bacterium]